MDADLETYLQAVTANQQTLHGDISTLNGYVSTTNTKLDSLISYVNDLLDAMPDAGSGNTAVDYSTSITSLCKLLSYTDLLLFVLLVFVVLICGMVLGSSITRWLKARRS